MRLSLRQSIEPLRARASSIGFRLLLGAVAAPLLCPLHALAMIPQEIAYGSLGKSIATADLVLSGEAIASTEECSGTTTSSPEAQAPCETTIEADHVYKGDVHPGNKVSVMFSQYSWMDNRYRYTAVGDYDLFVLCKSGNGYRYCPYSIGRAGMVRTSHPSSSAGSSGLSLLFADLVSGLSATGDNRRNSELIWALGDVVDVGILQKTESNLPLSARTDLDATIIRKSASACGADLREVSSLTRFNGVSIIYLADALNHSGRRCMDQVPYLIHSSSATLRLSALHILDESQDTSSIPLLASLIDDKEPSVAFNSMRILGEVLGYKPLNRPSFQEFHEVQAKRDALVEEWRAQLRSRGIEAMP